MSPITLSRTFLRLLALTALLSCLLVWGAADRLVNEAKQDFQAASAEECLTVTTCADDSSSDPFPDGASGQTFHPDLAAGQNTASFDFQPSGARLLSDPGLPRAPPA